MLSLEIEVRFLCSNKHRFEHTENTLQQPSHQMKSPRMNGTNGKSSALIILLSRQRQRHNGLQPSIIKFQEKTYVSLYTLQTKRNPFTNISLKKSNVLSKLPLPIKIKKKILVLKGKKLCKLHFVKASSRQIITFPGTNVLFT